MHLGNAFAFLMAWLAVRAQAGTLVLRVEDIDPDRSRPAFMEGIMDDLLWLGLFWDEGPPQGGPYAPYVQSQRTHLYEMVLAVFVQAGLAYPCYCTRKEIRQLASAPHPGDEGAPYPGTCRALSLQVQRENAAKGKPFALRLDVQAALRLLKRSERSDFLDGIRGLESFSYVRCGGDFALRRSDGVMAYQLAVAVDDALMGITEVVRGNDLVVSTPRQLLIIDLIQHLHAAQALSLPLAVPDLVENISSGARQLQHGLVTPNIPETVRMHPPHYAHLPLICDAQGFRLAKRHKSLEVRALRDAGITSEAIVGYLAWLGGLQKSMEPNSSSNLISAFSFAPLRGADRSIASDILAVLKTI